MSITLENIKISYRSEWKCLVCLMIFPFSYIGILFRIKFGGGEVHVSFNYLSWCTLYWHFLRTFFANYHEFSRLPEGELVTMTSLGRQRRCQKFENFVSITRHHATAQEENQLKDVIIRKIAEKSVKEHAGLGCEHKLQMNVSRVQFNEMTFLFSNHPPSSPQFELAFSGRNEPKFLMWRHGVPIFGRFSPVSRRDMNLNENEGRLTLVI